MKVGLFVPCYVDQFYPKVAIATLQLLENLGCDVDFPLGQTCCGQPMANAGFADTTAGCNLNMIRNFSGFDYIVSPSGSCVLHVKEHLHHKNFEQESGLIRNKIYELTEFLTDILKVQSISARFPHRVGFHVSCHGQRGLHLSSMSERVEPPFSKAMQLLEQVRELRLSYSERWDECCGFGGTFCVTEEAISVRMGEDRITAHEVNDIEYITGGDMSCLMHLEGILKRKKSKIKVIHLAEILDAQ